PTVTRAVMGASAGVDVTAELPKVIAPTLVMQSRNDRQLPAELTRALAESLPNGRIGLMAGTAATLFAEEGNADVDLILDFLTDGADDRARQSPIDDTAGLTPRELDVLRLVAGGETNAEIAHRLGLSVHTVERHAANVYRKIDARGRADATA